MNEIRVGVIGLGFMGRTHVGAYASAAAAGYGCSVVAVADARVEEIRDGGGRAEGNLRTAATLSLDWNAVRAYRDAAGLIADETVELISICTPTPTHVELASRALAAGKHVLLEKPVAVTSREIETLMGPAARSGKVCMPAMVMRFWPGWTWLRERIVDGAYGRLMSLHLERLGSRPAWSAAYADDAATGGALGDLHIHDVDFLYWCLGVPYDVRSTGSLAQVATQYRFAESTGVAPGACVTAVGGWGQQAAFGFRMRFVANFERATADFDLSRGEKPLVLSDVHGVRAIEVDTLSAYDAEVRHMLDVVRGMEPARASLADALVVAKILEMERAGLG